MRVKKIENGKTTVYIHAGQTILFEETFNTDDQTELGNADYYEKREFNILVGEKNLAKFIYEWDDVEEEWDESVNYHLPDHLGSRQVVCDSNGDVVTDGDIVYGTFGEYEDGLVGEYIPASSGIVRRG